jgi:hypothetical protein
VAALAVANQHSVLELPTFGILVGLPAVYRFAVKNLLEAILRGDSLDGWESESNCREK